MTVQLILKYHSISMADAKLTLYSLHYEVIGYHLPICSALEFTLSVELDKIRKQ